LLHAPFQTYTTSAHTHNTAYCCGCLVLSPIHSCNTFQQTLVKRAKHGDDFGDLDRTLASNIAKRQKFKETDLDADAEYDYDAGLDL
jgi:hypothetical protein